MKGFNVCPQCGSRWAVSCSKQASIVHKEKIKVESVYPLRRYVSVSDFEKAETGKPVVLSSVATSRTFSCGRCHHQWTQEDTQEIRIAQAQLPGNKVVAPFGEVNLWHRPDGMVRVKATLPGRPKYGSAQTGLAICGSSALEISAREIAGFLATLDAGAKVNVVHLGDSQAGGQIRELGAWDAAHVKDMAVSSQGGVGPVRLMPALKHFMDDLTFATWAIFVFIIEGPIDDFPEIREYTRTLARNLAAQNAPPVKLVLLGVGPAVDEQQLEMLDDLDYEGIKDANNQPMDLWDYKIAERMRSVHDLLAEVILGDEIVLPGAQLVDARGGAVQPVGNRSFVEGLPALLEFTMPEGSGSFSVLLADGKKITQPLH